AARAATTGSCVSASRSRVASGRATAVTAVANRSSKAAKRIGTSASGNRHASGGAQEGAEVSEEGFVLMAAAFLVGGAQCNRKPVPRYRKQPEVPETTTPEALGPLLAPGKPFAFGVGTVGHGPHAGGRTARVGA